MKQGKFAMVGRKTWSRVMGAMLVSALLLTGCSSNPDQDLAADQVTITVGAAASLKDVMNQLARPFMEANPDIKVQFTYGSSGILQQQIEQGSPIDVFLSAGEKQINTLDSKGLLVAGSRAVLARNQMVLVVPAQSGSVVTSFADLNNAHVKKIALGNPKIVPAGQYSMEVLTYYQLDDRLSDKLVFAEDVRQALTMVGTGNADAGIVYKTDAVADPRVKLVAEAPEESHSPIVYSIATVKSSSYQSAANTWVEYCLSAEAQKILASEGFVSK